MKKSYIFFGGLLVLSLCVALRVMDPFFIEIARLKGLDSLQRSVEPRLAENVAIVEIDEASLEKFGQWPWERTEFGRAIERAYDSGAALVVLPILFAEPDRFHGDKDFAQTLNDFPVVNSQSASLAGKGSPTPRGVAVIGEGLHDWLFSYPAAIGPLESIASSSAGVGMLLTAPELDGVVRRLPLLISISNEAYPTIPLEVLRVFGGEQSYQARMSEAGLDAVRVPGFDPIRTDANGRVWIPFRYTFDKVSYTSDDWTPHISEKIVFFSLRAEGLANTVATPLGTSYGDLISAVTLQALIDGVSLRRDAEFDLYEIASTILLLLLLLLLAARSHYVLNGLAFLLATVSIVAGTRYAFANHNLLLDVTWPILTVTLGWGTALFLRFVSEFRQKQQIKKQFGTYLSPAMVEKLQKNPELLRLGGEERELSIMFTDVRGFTAISEHYGSNVEGLTKIMNRYMTAMTQPILESKGTLDKYIGDAQMAFWNAPLDDDDHASHALETALIMLERLKTFNREIEAEGVPAFGMGLGINTGRVIVGNMGSTQRFDYTCLGDAVNLASRLEGQSKPYGVPIILGQNTAEQVRFRHPLLELDLIAVKGKKEGIRIFTYNFKHKTFNTIAHTLFLLLYRTQQWDRALSVMQKNTFLKDYYSMMEERISTLRESGLSKDWDGIFRATSK